MKNETDWLGDYLRLVTQDGVSVVYDRAESKILGLRDNFEQVGVEFELSGGTWTEINRLCDGDGLKGWPPFQREDTLRVKGLLKYLQGRDRLRIVAEAEG